MAKKAYLTIDDTPSEDLEPKIKFLKSKGIPAILFCEGQKLEERPKLAIKAIKEGFIIGNHSYSHPHFSKISLEKGKKEIQDTEEIIEDLYQKAEKDRPIKAFRFPYGDFGAHHSKKRVKRLQEFLQDQGFEKPRFEKITYDGHKEHRERLDWFWTFNPQEYKDSKTLQQVIKEIQESERLEDPGSEDIILVHDHTDTTEQFQPIIRAFLEKGIQFKPLPI